MRDLKLALLQQELVWQDAPANRDRFEACIEPLSGMDIIALPEMFNTGFCMEASRLAETEDGETCRWMKRMAAEKNAVVTGSLMIREEGKFFNRLYWFEPSGLCYHYNKRHLFSLAGEEKIFSPGTEILHIDYLGWRIKPMVCYDLRFPVWSRNTDECDLLFYTASWPARRSLAWTALLQARAIENLCWVAGLNRCGLDGNGEPYNGDTRVYDPLGQLELDGGTEPGVYTITLPASRIAEVRHRFSFLNDRDEFQLLL